MKKIVTLFMASALVLAASAPASAVDVKVDGRYQFVYQVGEGDFTGSNADAAHSRIRLGLTFSASENLSGYFQTESRWEWGTNDKDMGNGTAFDGAKVAVNMRQAYIDWVIPGTEAKVRMGRQSVTLPSYASANAHINDLISDGVVVDMPFNDTYSLSAFWLRTARAAGTNGYATDTHHSEKYDLFGLVGTAAYDSLTVSPWAIYGSKGAGIAGDAQGSIGSGLYAGAHGDIMTLGTGIEWRPFDPVTLAVDAGYGKVGYTDYRDQEGWFAVGKAAYKLSFAEPAIMGWFSSGDGKGDMKRSGQFPVIYGDFNGSSTFFDNTYGPCVGNSIHNMNFAGTWGVSAQLNGLSFLEGLSHDLSVTYIGGTNSKYNGDYGKPNEYNGYLTTRDGMVEFEILSTYEIYTNLSTALELAYIIEDFDTSAKYGRAGQQYDNAWRAALHFQYMF